MLRIGIDATPAARQGGGIGRYVRELLRALSEADTVNAYRVLVASPRPLPQPLPPLPQGARLVHLPLHDRWLVRLWHRARLPAPIELALGRLDLYHSPDFTLPPTLPGTPTILTVHDLSFVRDPDSASPALKHYLDGAVPRSVRQATRVFADSQATRADLIELYDTPPEKIEVLYSGVDERFQPVVDRDKLQTVRVRYGLGNDPFILAVGSLHPRKNFVRLIQAFAQLRSSVTASYRLVIAGGREWSSEPTLAEPARLGLESAVVFPGFVDDVDLPALYSAAAAFAYPSIYEGFGLPVLEAMACGLPAVTSTASCLPEVAGDAALLVDPLDVEALAVALERVLTDADLRTTLRENGRARAHEFTWHRAARQLLQAYRRVGGAAGQRSGVRGQ
jgi:glycosyltransferase involved in cell wall biosynthesis